MVGVVSMLRDASLGLLLGNCDKPLDSVNLQLYLVMDNKFIGNMILVR